MAMIIERDPVLFVKNYYDLTRPEARQKYARSPCAWSAQSACA
jgi:hypothetical protein